MNSSEIFKIIEQIAATPGKNDKLALVKANIEDAEFRGVLKMTYDPFMVFGVGEKTMADIANMGRGMGRGDCDHRAWKLLSYIADRSITGDQMKHALSLLIAELNEPSAALLRRILLKDLRAGFSESTINKASKGLIPTFPYMRCSLPKDSNIKKPAFWKNGAVAQLKADGMFCNTNFDNAGVVWLTSRQGSPLPIDSLPGLEEQIRIHLTPGTQTHGELVVVGPDGKILAREIGNGMLNSVIKGGSLPDDCTVRLMVWDQVPLSAVVPKGKYEVLYLIRLTSLIKQTKGGEQVQLIETRVCRTLEEMTQFFKEKLLQGEEGAIGKSCDTIWRDGDSKDQVKFKLKVAVELRVTGFNEGTGKNAGSLGSLQCESACGRLRVDVSGRGDDMRAQVWADKEDWMFAIVTVEFNMILEPARGEFYSLFLPIFVERRLDKDTADTLERIQAQFDAAVRGEI